MKIQLWKRKNYSKNRYNLYIRYRISQNKAKVESLNLWEWISPKGKVEIKHNYDVKIACDEILRRTRDDIENGRSNINIDQSNDYSFKNAFFKYSKINNTQAVYRFIKNQKENIDLLSLGDINEKFLNELKILIENKIAGNDIMGSTASKYWNNFKTVLININKNGLCEYPKVSGIKYSKKKRTNKVFSKSEIEKLRRNKSNNNLINAFLFTCSTGTKLSIIRKLKWGEIKNNNNHNYYIRFKSKNKERIIPFDLETRLYLGKRKKDNTYVFNLDKNKSSLSRQFKKELMKANIDVHKNYDDGINTYAKDMYAKTKNIYLISASLGHNSINKTKEHYPYMEEKDIFKNYFEIKPKEEKSVKRKIGKKLFKKGNLLGYKKDTL